MAGTAAADHPRALVHARVGAPGFDRAVADLTAVIDEVRPQVVISYDADGGYGHPDHIAAHQIARAASRESAVVRRFFAVVRPEEAVRHAIGVFTVAPGYLHPLASDLGFRTTSERVTVRIPVLDHHDRHRAALAAHATQVDVLPSGFALSNRIAQPILDAEYYALIEGEPLPLSAESADDLFLGLR